jgi:HEAT repeat protein
MLSSATAPEADRARAARVLGAMEGEPAAAALLAALGKGPPALRTAVVDALARAPGTKPDAVLAAIASAPAGDAREADLLRLLPSTVKRAPDTRTPAIAALRAALVPARVFETRARAVMALGAMATAGDPAALVEVATRGDHPVLRYLAARELAAWPAGVFDVRTPMQAALTDQDPRVRETAALALGKHGDASANALLIDAAKQEPWPIVRRAELDALGRLCGPGTGDLMIHAINVDVSEVRRAALVSLARCKDPRARITLLRTLARKKESATIRELSAALIGESGDRSATRLLAEALRRVVVESEGDLALEGVAVAALRALARLGGPDAVDAAATLAMDTRHPFRPTAIEALGVLCDPDRGQATLRVLMSGKDAQLAAAAQNAEKHCAAQAKQ